MSATNLAQMRTVLAATDFSFTAERAFEHARSIASRAGAELRIVHVAAPREGLGEGEGQIGAPAREAELEERMRRLLRDAERASCHVHHGRAAEVIVTEAAKTAADLIVIGANGLNNWRRPRLGSTARRVIEHAPCPC